MYSATDAVEERGDDGIVAVAHIGAHDALELVGDAEDLLQDDKAAFAALLRRGAECLERKAVGGGELDRRLGDVGRFAGYGCLARSGVSGADHRETATIHKIDNRYDLHWPRE